MHPIKACSAWDQPDQGVLPTLPAWLLLIGAGSCW
jgi:hypothetical protein